MHQVAIRYRHAKLSGGQSVNRSSICASQNTPDEVDRSPERLRYNVSQRGQIMPTTMVHVRVDQKTKDSAAKTLAAMGISVSDAVRMLLVRVAAEKALPFEVRVPNATTVKAMRAADRGKGKRLSSADLLFKDLGI